MGLYADRPATRLRQFVTDQLVIAWIIAWVRAAAWVYDRVSMLAAPGERIEGAGLAWPAGSPTPVAGSARCRPSVTSSPPR
jgi:hypothetical protein